MTRYFTFSNSIPQQPRFYAWVGSSSCSIPPSKIRLLQVQYFWSEIRRNYSGIYTIQTRMTSFFCWLEKASTHNKYLNKSPWNKRTSQITDPSGDLKSRLVWILNGQREFALQMVKNLNWIWNSEAQPSEIWTNGHHFVKNHLKSGQKGLDFEWLGLMQ